MVAICASFGEGKHYEGKTKTPGRLAGRRPGQTTKTTPVQYLSLAERSMSFVAKGVAVSGPHVNLADLSRDEIKAAIIEERAATPVPTKAGKQASKKQMSSPRELLELFAVTDEYISKLGKE